MNILFLYNSTQTFTNTVFEHLAAFSKYSKHRSFFCHHDQFLSLNINLSQFDAVVLHYTIRLPFDQVSDSTVHALEKYSGLKVLFIQDEYDNTYKAWKWIKQLGFNLVFTVVPTENIARVYPPEQFPDVEFVNNLTGYVPEELTHLKETLPTAERQLVIGYRGRPLPIRYGKLGQEKIDIGRMVKIYCESNDIVQDIAWTEDARIYGPKWYEFMGSCRAMLGSESGSNVFAWDGLLDRGIKNFLAANERATENDIYINVVEPFEISGLMNQVSPRVFEAIASRTILVLFEGNYSGVVLPGVHYISLKKDGSNLDEVFALLNDAAYIENMAERAYQDIIASGRYSYKSFVKMIDEEIESSFRHIQKLKNITGEYSFSVLTHGEPTPITLLPIRAQPPLPSGEKLTNSKSMSQAIRGSAKRLAVFSWHRLPAESQNFLKPRLKRLLRRE